MSSQQRRENGSGPPPKTTDKASNGPGTGRASNTGVTSTGSNAKKSTPTGKVPEGEKGKTFSTVTTIFTTIPQKTRATVARKRLPIRLASPVKVSWPLLTLTCHAPDDVMQGREPSIDGIATVPLFKQRQGGRRRPCLTTWRITKQRRPSRRAGTQNPDRYRLTTVTTELD
jgi:hypothetical protein